MRCARRDRHAAEAHHHGKSIRREWCASGSALLIVGVGWAAYGYVLGLPLFLDDMVHLRWLEGRPLVDIWRSAETIGYYRPLTFTIWAGLRAIQGWYHPPTLHALNLVLHLANALLVARLARQAAGLLSATAAGILFLLYPFSYQAVPWVGALCHPLVTAMLLGAIALSLDGGGRRWARTGSLLLAALAPFVHEGGTLVAPLLTVTLWALRRLSARQLLRQTAPFWVLAILGSLAWLVAPKSVGQIWLWNLESRWQNGVYFLQGLGYPTAPLANSLLAHLPRLDDLQAIVLACLPAIALWAAVGWRAGQRRAVVMALGWYALGLLPAWLMLDFSYVIDGPRLMYLGSAGAALFWALPLGVVRVGSPTRARRLRMAGAAAAVWAAVMSSIFLVQRADLYRGIGEAVWGLVAAAGELPGSTSLTAINYPWWIAPRKQTFAVGHEGVTLVPPYTSVGELLWLHTGQERAVHTIVAGELRDDWRHWVGCVGDARFGGALVSALQESDEVLLTRYTAHGIEVLPVGHALLTPAEDTALAVFDGVALQGATWQARGAVLELTLVWAADSPPPEDTTVFVHLYDATGHLVSQADGDPLGGAAPLHSWRPGEAWLDRRWAPLPTGEGPWNIAVGLYDRNTGKRVKASLLAAREAPGDAVHLGVLVRR